MGLFGGVFQKESCCICGGKTGMLDKKTLDGKVCKDCTKELWMVNRSVMIRHIWFICITLHCVSRWSIHT